jgi:hypothetical protein
MNAVYIEENGAYQFDFSQALWATDELHRAFHSTHVDLSDVDFVAETETELILLEYKNATITGAVKPEAFRPSDDNKIKKIAWKYYDSWIYLMALKKKNLVHMSIFLSTQELTSNPKGNTKQNHE